MIPIGVKDLEDAKGFVTTYGSELHVNDNPAEEDSILVKRLRDQGCVVHVFPRFFLYYHCLIEGHY